MAQRQLRYRDWGQNHVIQAFTVERSPQATKQLLNDSSAICKCIMGKLAGQRTPLRRHVFAIASLSLSNAAAILIRPPTHFHS